MALELQTLAGMDVGFGRTRETSQKGVYNVVFAYMEAEAGVYTAKATVRIAQALVDGKDYDLAEDIQALREIREEYRLGPSTGSLVEEAAARGSTNGRRTSMHTGHTEARTIRLSTKHEALLSGLLLRLDRPSRVNRFGHPASDASVKAYAKQALSTSVFMAGVAAEGKLVAVVEAFAANRDGIVEVAFAVDGDWRRRGLCSALLDAAKHWAEQAGITTLRMVIARGNWPMRQLAHKAGARLDLELDEICADIAVSAPAALAMAA